MSNFIPHNGEYFPHNSLSIVEAHFRKGKPPVHDRASRLNWKHTGGDNDIIGYTVIIPAQDSPDWETYLEVMEAVGLYTGLRDCRNQRFEQFSYPQRLYVLSDMLKLHVLRECGDIKKYLQLDEQMNTLPLPNNVDGAVVHYARQSNLHDKLIKIMMTWLEQAMQDIRPPHTVSTREKVVISMLIWGDKYVQKMLGSSFKSMLADGNLPTLAKEKYIIIYLQTDAASKEIIENAPETKKLKEHGVHFEYVLFPDDLTPHLKGEMAIYWMVGAGATLGIHYAKKAGAAFHHSYPDIIYSDKYFSELLRLSRLHNSILGPAHRADESIFLPALKPYEDEDKISIPSADLIAVHLNNLHMSTYPCFVNNRPQFWRYPQSHVMIWESENEVHFNCPHLNALWLSPSVLKHVPDRYFMSLDSELDLICKGEDYYIPQAEDELYLVEFSEQSRYPVTDAYADARTCGNFMWGTITHRDLFKFFARGMKVKINREIRKVPPNVIGYVQISAEKTYLFNAMMDTDHYAGVQLARPRSHEGRIFAYVG